MSLSPDYSMKQMAVIVDLDETLCTEFDVPVSQGIAVLRGMDPRSMEVHYVTARTASFRLGTEKFLVEHRLPGAQNVHYCPEALGSFEHKRRLHELLSEKYDVIASIGDSVEEEQAAKAAGVFFVLVDPCEPALAWARLEERIGSCRH